MPLEYDMTVLCITLVIELALYAYKRLSDALTKPSRRVSPLG